MKNALKTLFQEKNTTVKKSTKNHLFFKNTRYEDCNDYERKYHTE